MTARNPDHFALLIGIHNYPQLPPLPAVTTDVAGFSRWLLEVGGLDPKNIAIVKSPPTNSLASPEPVHLTITRELQRFGVVAALKDGRRIGQRLYFYFSGHGIGPDFDDIGMLMADASADLLDQNIGLRPYRRLFKRNGLFDEVIYVLDCCRDHSQEAEAQRPMITVRPGPLPPRETKEFVIMAAPWGTQAFEAQIAGNAERSGLLTRALLEGLGLDGPPRAIDPLGRVTSTILWSYLRERVPQLAQQAEVDQRPQADGAGRDEPIVLARFPLDPAKAVTLTINVKPNVAGTLVVLMEQIDRTRAEVVRREFAGAAAGHTWAVALRPGFVYAVSHLQTRLSLEVDLGGVPDGGVVNRDFPPVVGGPGPVAPSIPAVP